MDLDDLDDPVFATATALAAAIRTRRVSATEIARAHLARIERLNRELNAVVTLDEEGTLRQARAADAALARGELRGPLHGVPLTLKDAHATAGMRTTAGHAPLAEHVPQADGAVAARLRAAGAVIMGKTNVPELLEDIQTDNPLFGRTANPWDVARTPGGSSGGAAAALAAGMTPLEIGSDLGGSIRLPAHFCGLFALAPTQHRISQAGHIPPLPGSPATWREMGVVGPMARAIDDLELAFRILAGPDPSDLSVPPVPVAAPLSPPAAPPAWSALRLAWAPTFPGLPADAATRDTLSQLVTELGRTGCIVEETLPDVDFVGQQRTYVRLYLHVTRALAPPPPGKAPFSLADHFRVLDARDAVGRRWEAFFQRWDALLCPVSMTAAFAHCPTGAARVVDGREVGYWRANEHCTPFNLTGLPVVVLPCGADRRDGRRLPIGVQLVGPRWSDERLLAIARRLSEVSGAFARPPER